MGLDLELAGDGQLILDVAWMFVEQLRCDVQVSRVLPALEAHR